MTWLTSYDYSANLLIPWDLSLVLKTISSRTLNFSLSFIPVPYDNIKGFGNYMSNFIKSLLRLIGIQFTSSNDFLSSCLLSIICSVSSDNATSNYTKPYPFSSSDILKPFNSSIIFSENKIVEFPMLVNLIKSRSK